MIVQVSRSLCTLINDSPSLQHQVGLAISGFDDSKLIASLDIHQRANLLTNAERLWRGQLGVSLIDTIQCFGLEYWPSRDLAIMNSVALDDPQAVEVLQQDSVAFDVSLVPNIASSWRIQLPKTAGLIACADPSQDLVVLRRGQHIAGQSLLDHWYCLSLCTLSTGEPHPSARNPRMEFKVSQRLVQNSHYIRVHILDDLVSMNMPSDTNVFTETVFFDWKTGILKAVSLSGFFESTITD